MFKVSIIPLMFPPGEDCGEFNSVDSDDVWVRILQKQVIADERYTVK